MTIFKKFKKIIIDAVTMSFGDSLADFDLSRISVEQPKETTHGDLSTNVAMILAKTLGKNPREVAQKIADLLAQNEGLTKVEIAGPGFINISLDDKIILNELTEIISNPSYGSSEIGNGIKVNLEFISANPTGPLHVGHLRNAFFGNALANLLIFSGYDVFKEFYVNDAGGQIIVLANSCFLRYKELCTGKKEEIPEGLYPGDYLIDIAKQIHIQHSDSLLNMAENERLEIFKSLSVSLILDLIKTNLDLLGIKFDLFFSEKSLHDQNKIQPAVDALQAKGLLYRGVLDAPKGKTPEDWEPREQLLFKSTSFGDDVDRPLQKSDGSWAYFSADLAYLYDKISRGFDQLIFILGADHGGYKSRLTAACKALGDNKVDIDVKIMQLVQFVKNGEAVKMSKRSGNFLLSDEVIAEVGKDAASFTMLTRSNDQAFDFDFEKVKETTKDNPIFYVQYSHARINSVFRAAKGEFPAIYEIFDSKKYNLSELTHPKILNFIKKLSSFPKIIELATLHHEPHRVIFYLIEISSEFHYLWSLGKDEASLRFLDSSEPNRSASYLALLSGYKNILTGALKLFNIDPIDSM